MKIHIVGASGSGVTTLGKALAQNLNIPYFDSDEYYWEHSDPPFTIKREADKRNSMLENDLAKHQLWILGGSVVSWGPQWPQLFDLVIFLWVAPAIRMKRLAKREYERYGSIIYTSASRNVLYNQFMEWAAAYDEPNNTRRSLAVHEDWLRKLGCKVLEIRGDFTVEERLNKVLEVLQPIM